MVSGEVILVACLLAVAVNLFQSRHGVPAAGPILPPAALASPPARPTTEAGPRISAHPTSSSAPRRITPGPAISRDTFPLDLERLNRDQAKLEAAQATAISRLTAALRAYLERVVVPAVLRAERPATATTPATTQSSAASRKIP